MPFREIRLPGSEEGSEAPPPLVGTELPCVEYPTDGPAKIADLPSKREVGDIMAALCSSYAGATDLRNWTGPWYRSYDATTDTAPPYGERGLSAASVSGHLSTVCDLLAGPLLGSWSKAIAENPGVFSPAGWGLRTYPTNLDRLFARVGVGHTYAAENLVRVDWWVSADVALAFGQTAFAYPTADNAWVGLRQHLNSTVRPESILDKTLDALQNVALVCIAVPRISADAEALYNALRNRPDPLLPRVPYAPVTTPFPADYRTANNWGLLSPAGLPFLNALNTPITLSNRAEFPPGLLQDIADELDPFTSESGGVAGVLDWVAKHHRWIDAVLDLYQKSGAPSIGSKATWALYLDEVEGWWDTIVDVVMAFRDVARTVDRINDNGELATNAMSDILMGLGTIANFGDNQNESYSLIGVSRKGLFGVARALSQEDHWYGGVNETLQWSRPTPVVLLDDCVHQAIRTFSDWGSDERAPDVVASQRALATLWFRWSRSVAPVHQAVQCIDAAGRVAVGLVRMDDSFSAGLPVMAQVEGLLGDGISEALDVIAAAIANLQPQPVPTVQRRVRHFAQGFDVPAVIGYSVRQALTDVLIGLLVRAGYGEECLWQLVPWMDSESKRDNIVAALGPTIQVTAPTSLRASLLSGSKERQLSVRIRTAFTSQFRGALGAMLSAFIRPQNAQQNNLLLAQAPPLIGLAVAGLQPFAGQTLGRVPGTNLEAVLRWLRSAQNATSCDWRGNIEPAWNTSKNEPSPGDFEPPDTKPPLTDRVTKL